MTCHLNELLQNHLDHSFCIILLTGPISFDKKNYILLSSINNFFELRLNERDIFYWSLIQFDVTNINIFCGIKKEIPLGFLSVLIRQCRSRSTVVYLPNKDVLYPIICLFRIKYKILDAYYLDEINLSISLLQMFHFLCKNIIKATHHLVLSDKISKCMKIKLDCRIYLSLHKLRNW